MSAILEDDISVEELPFEEYVGEGWEEEEDESEDIDDGDDASMSPTELTVAVRDSTPAKRDNICYHCQAVMVMDDGSSLHCESCIRGVHSQCHLALGGQLPTQEAQFHCLHCVAAQHGKYSMLAANRVRVLVGEAHQVPDIPPLWFTVEGRERLNIARRRPVQVWSAEAARAVVPSDRVVQDYLSRAAQLWPEKIRVNSIGSLAPGSVRRLYVSRAALSQPLPTQSLNHYWCPFSPEYALTVLHKCHYKVEEALRGLTSPLLRDCFTQVCHPPRKPYYNKWKPKDRRWRMMKIPYPTSRVEAPVMDASAYPREGFYTQMDGEGPRLRSRRVVNYNYGY